MPGIKGFYEARYVSDPLYNYLYSQNKPQQLWKSLEAQNYSLTVFKICIVILKQYMVVY